MHTYTHASYVWFPLVPSLSLTLTLSFSLFLSPLSPSLALSFSFFPGNGGWIEQDAKKVAKSVLVGLIE